MSAAFAIVAALTKWRFEMRELTFNEVQMVSGNLSMTKENAGEWATYYGAIGGLSLMVGFAPGAAVALTMSAGFALWAAS